MSRKNVSRLQLINEFESAPDSTLFNQNTLAAVLECRSTEYINNLLNGKEVNSDFKRYLKLYAIPRYSGFDNTISMLLIILLICSCRSGQMKALAKDRLP